jgi:hypothetical protein
MLRFYCIQFAVYMIIAFLMDCINIPILLLMFPISNCFAHKIYGSHLESFGEFGLFSLFVLISIIAIDKL